MSQPIRIGHSPDPDDAFMFCATAHEKIDLEGLTLEHVLEDIETLNTWSFDGKLEVTAVSLHTYAHVADRYVLTAAGSSLGHGYGPRFVAKPGVTKEQAFAGTVAIPGVWTSAFLAAQLYAGSFDYIEVPFDQIIETVRSGKATCGLVIHEGQLTYADEGLILLEDLGAWWAREQDGLPLPLGVNVIRRDLGPERIKQLARIVENSIQWGIENRQEALNYALQWGRGIDQEVCDKFVTMYVNKTTLDFGEEGREAVRRFLDAAYQAQLIPHQVKAEFIKGN